MDIKRNEIANSYKGRIVSGLISLDYGLDEILTNTGKNYEKLQEYEDALSCYNEALEINSEYKEALKAKEEVLKLMGRL